MKFKVGDKVRLKLRQDTNHYVSVPENVWNELRNKGLLTIQSIQSRVYKIGVGDFNYIDIIDLEESSWRFLDIHFEESYTLPEELFEI